MLPAIIIIVMVWIARQITSGVEEAFLLEPTVVLLKSPVNHQAHLATPLRPLHIPMHPQLNRAILHNIRRHGVPGIHPD